MRALLVLLAVGLIALFAWITLGESPTEESDDDRPSAEKPREHLVVPPVVEPDPVATETAKKGVPAPAAGPGEPAAPPVVEHLATVRGRVVDEKGEGVAGVFVRSNESSKSGSGETAADGSFTIGVQAGEHVLTVAGLGIVSPEGGVAIKAPADKVVIRVTRIRIGRGTVVTEADGKPVASATVRLTLSTGGWSQTNCNALGVFGFDLSDPGYDNPRMRFTVLVTADGYVDAELADLTLEEVLPDASLIVKLVQDIVVEPGRLSGRVRYDTGAPFYGSLTLSFSSEGKAGEIFRIETNEQGEFLVPKVAAGEYVLRSAPHGESILRETGKTLVIPPGGEATTEFTLTRGGDLKFKATGRDGKVLENVELFITDEEGTETRTFRLVHAEGTIRDIAPGKVKLRVAKDGYTTAESEVTVVKDQAVEASVQLEEKR